MNIRISIGISCLLIHPQPPRLSIRRGRSDAIGGVLRRNLSLHHSTAQTAGKENRRFRAYPNLRARDGRLTFRMSGQEPELCSTMVYKDDRTGRGPAATADKCHLNLLFLSLVRARHAGHAQQPAARPARPARPISPRPIVRFLEKNLYLPALTRPNLLQAPKHDIYRRAVDICLRAVDICRIRSQQNADPDILSREKKNFLEKDDIGRHWSTSDTPSIPFPPPASSPAAHTTDRAAHGRPGNAHAAAIPPHFGAPAVAQPVGCRFCGGI